MQSSAITRFFGVVSRPRTWLNLLFQWLAFPLGLFYFVFLVVGLSLGVGLLIIWVGIPILLVMAGAWWLFGSFERLQAQYLLGAAVGPAPRSWESVDGVWAKLKAHFGNGATWRDLAYLLAKLPFGVVSFSLAVALFALVAWLAAWPVAWYMDFHIAEWGNGRGFTPTGWEGVLAVPAAILMFFVALHALNAWGWVCARWAELLLGTPPQPAPRAGLAPASPAPLVSTGPAPAPPPLVSTGPAAARPAQPGAPPASQDAHGPNP